MDTSSDFVGWALTYSMHTHRAQSTTPQAGRPRQRLRRWLAIEKNRESTPGVRSSAAATLLSLIIIAYACTQWYTPEQQGAHRRWRPGRCGRWSGRCAAGYVVVESSAGLGWVGSRWGERSLAALCLLPVRLPKQPNDQTHTGARRLFPQVHSSVRQGTGGRRVSECADCHSFEVGGWHDR